MLLVTWPYLHTNTIKDVQVTTHKHERTTCTNTIHSKQATCHLIVRANSDHPRYRQAPRGGLGGCGRCAGTHGCHAGALGSPAIPGPLRPRTCCLARGQVWRGRAAAAAPASRVPRPP